MGKTHKKERSDLYEKDHSNPKAMKDHIKKIKARGGEIVYKDKDTIQYDFPANPAPKKSKAKSKKRK